jgi:hypothetical protein
MEDYFLVEVTLIDYSRNGTIWFKHPREAGKYSKDHGGFATMIERSWWLCHYVCKIMVVLPL